MIRFTASIGVPVPPRNVRADFGLWSTRYDDGDFEDFDEDKVLANTKL